MAQLYSSRHKKTYKSTHRNACIFCDNNLIAFAAADVALLCVCVPSNFSLLGSFIFFFVFVLFLKMCMQVRQQYQPETVVHQFRLVFQQLHCLMFECGTRTLLTFISIHHRERENVRVPHTTADDRIVICVIFDGRKWECNNRPYTDHKTDCTSTESAVIQKKCARQFHVCNILCSCCLSNHFMLHGQCQIHGRPNKQGMHMHKVWHPIKCNGRI